MSTEPAAAAADGGRESMQRLLIEALAKGGGDRAAFKEVLAGLPMAPDQRSLMDMLLAMDQGEGGPGSEPAPPVEEPTSEGPRDRAMGQEPRDRATSQELRALSQELRDLREVNDTLAAALGACRACWGGDAACPECEGRGRAGSRRPDAALFRELVLPAVRRVRSLEQTARPAFRRPRW